MPELIALLVFVAVLIAIESAVAFPLEVVVAQRRLTPARDALVEAVPVLGRLRVSAFAVVRLRMSRVPAFTTGHGLGMPCRSGSALRAHVSRIVAAGPKEQVVDPDAESYVALVAYLKTGWDRAVGHLPRRAVRVLMSLRRHRHIAVTVPRGPRPQPAAARLVDLRPETIRDGLRCGHTYSVTGMAM